MIKQPRNTLFVLFMIAIIAGTVYYYNRPEDKQIPAEDKTERVEITEFNTKKFEGTYKSPDGAFVVTTVGEDEIYIEAEALWANELTTNVGRAKGNVKLTEGSGTIKDGECEIQIKITERKITSTDNSKCGGFNVSFSGEYLKN